MNTLKYILTIFIFIGCRNPEYSMIDPNLHFDGEYIYYQNEKFTGTLISEFEANGNIRRTPFQNGQTHGIEIEKFAEGTIASERIYEKGKRVGIHRGWYANGNIRFQYEYEDGLMHGFLWEWKPDGSLYSFTKMDKGIEIGKKIWREDGQIYANYVFRNGRTIGLPGAKLCRQVKGDANGNTKTF